jgi:hypothetical protein
MTAERACCNGVRYQVVNTLSLQRREARSALRLRHQSLSLFVIAIADGKLECEESWRLVEEQQ